MGRTLFTSLNQTRMSMNQKQLARAVGAAVLGFAALSASDLSALGDGWQVLTQKGETVYVCRLARRAVALGITADAIRTQFHFIQNDWKTGDVTTS